GVLGDEVEDTLAIAFAAFAGRGGLGGVGAGKEPVEDQLRVDLLGLRRRLAAPGDVRRVGATVARVAVAGGPARLAADLQRRESRSLANLLGGKLVNRGADLDVGAGGLARLAASQES